MKRATPPKCDSSQLHDLVPQDQVRAKNKMETLTEIGRLAELLKLKEWRVQLLRVERLSPRN